MTQYYFCNQEVSDNILKNIPLNNEYEALIYEDMLRIDFLIPRDIVKTNIKVPSILIEGSVGDETTIQMIDTYKHVTIKGHFNCESIISLAFILGMGEKFLEKISHMNNPRCPIKVAENKNIEKDRFIENLLVKSEATPDVEW